MLPGAAEEQHDDQKAHQGKGDVAVDAPGKRGFGAEPLVLRHHAKDDAHGSQPVDGSGQALLPLDPVALTPHIVEQHIKNCHRDRGDPLAESQGHGVVFQTRGAERQRTGNQMEGVTGAQHNGHQAEQPELRVALTPTDHQDTDGDDRYQIDGIKYSFYDCLHRSVSPFC